MRQLTKEAQDDRDRFLFYRAYFGDCLSLRSSCICDYCQHPGNPKNQLDDSFYEPEKVEGEDFMDVVKDLCG